MKKIFEAALSLMVLAGMAGAWADTTGVTKVTKTHKHKGHWGGKTKKPGADVSSMQWSGSGHMEGKTGGSGSGVGGSSAGQPVNKNQ